LPLFEPTGSQCEGEGWIPFKDEKCFKLFEEWMTREKAQILCANAKLLSDPNPPVLATVETEEEQQFLNSYIYETSQVETNVWIGAKRGEENQFVWDNGEFVGRKFSNWAKDAPSDDTRR